jgi:hypothetical protein
MTAKASLQQNMGLIHVTQHHFVNETYNKINVLGTVAFLKSNPGTKCLQGIAAISARTLDTK